MAAAGPAAPAVGEAATALALYAAFLVAFGLLYVWRHSLGAVLHTFAAWAKGVTVGIAGHGVHPLSPIADASDWIDSLVDNALSAAVEATQRGSLALFHLAGHQLQRIGDEIGGLAYDVSQAFVRTATVTVPAAVYRAQNAAVRRITSLERSVEHAIASTIPAIQGRISTLDRARKAAEAKAAREALTIDHAVTVTLPHEIAHVGGRVGSLERKAEREAGRLGRLEKLLAGAGFAALVLTALGRLGLNWIRCPALGRISKKHGCSPWQALEHVLAPALDVLVFLDICTIAAIVRTAATKARPVLDTIVVGADAALCGGKRHVPPNLPLPTLSINVSANPLEL